MPLGLLAAPALRAAEPRDPAAAEVLFNEGKELLQKGDVHAACSKFEESFRLDAASGALFALAVCHEQEGRTASAWVEFTEVAGRANAERNQEREQSARERAAALLPRLSSLVTNVNPRAAALPGFVVKRDGVELKPAAWGAPIPLDPGRHTIRAEAPGYVPWEVAVTIGKDADKQIIDIPELELAPKNTAAPLIVEKVRVERVGPNTLQLVGIGLGGAAVASFGFAIAATVRAAAKNSDSEQNCPDGVCNEEGREDRYRALEAANFATIGAIVGGGLLGAGAALFVVGTTTAKRETRTGLTLELTGTGARAKLSF